MANTKATGVHKIHSTFSTSGGVLSFYRDNASTQLAFGESGTGLDVKFNGDTVSAWVLWDESADTLLGASSATLNWLGTVTVSGGATFSGAVTMTGSADFTGANVHITSASTQIGNAGTDKIGFFGATPVVQLANVASTAVTSTIAISVLDYMRLIGLMASA